MKNNKKPILFTDRIGYKPREYTSAFTFWEKQLSVFWVPREVQLADNDVKDFNVHFSESEKNLIAKILKGFTHTETVVNEYWSKYVTSWFPKHEIKMMGISFAAFETIHAESYSNLNEELGLDDFEEFLEDEATAAKIENIQKIDELAYLTIKDPETYTLEDIRNIARSLAIFSAFTEGVNLFSSFAIILNFTRRGLLRAVGQLIKFSIRDESLHSTGGCWLYNQIISEVPEVLNEQFKNDILEAARLTVKLEEDFIEKAFDVGEIEGISKEQMKSYIRFRCNIKLNDIGFEGIFDYNQQHVNDMDWFTSVSAGVEYTDFFANRVTEYAKGQQDWNALKNKLKKK